MSILQYNGSAIVAMVGKDCVAIASDMRYGIQQQTIACDMKKVFQMGDKLFIGLSGLLTDVQTLKQKFDFKLKMYSLRENRPMRPKVFSSLVSSTLYEKRIFNIIEDILHNEYSSDRFGPYFVEPVVAGLDAKEGPFIAAMDLIGAPVFAKDFVVSGTTSDELYGVCEAFWKPNMGPDELFETISQSLLAAVDRDCLAGWGAIVHVITKDGVTTKQLKSRKD